MNTVERKNQAVVSMDADDLEEMDIDAPVEKIMEKCRFWPACKAGDQCPYHHPTVQCK